MSWPGFAPSRDIREARPEFPFREPVVVEPLAVPDPLEFRKDARMQALEVRPSGAPRMHSRFCPVLSPGTVLLICGLSAE